MGHSCRTLFWENTTHPAHQRHAAFMPSCFPSRNGTKPRNHTFRQGWKPKGHHPSSRFLCWHLQYSASRPTAVTNPTLGNRRALWAPRLDLVAHLSETLPLGVVFVHQIENKLKTLKPFRVQQIDAVPAEVGVRHRLRWRLGQRHKGMRHSCHP